MKILSMNLCLESPKRSVKAWARFLKTYDLVGLQESCDDDGNLLGKEIAEYLGWYYHGHPDAMGDLQSDHDQCLISPFPIPNTVRSVHLSNGDEYRNLRQKELRTSLRGRKKPLIVLGDFNETPDEPCPALMRSWGYRSVAEGNYPTHPARYHTDPHQQIDYIFVRPEVEVFEVAYVDSGMSDHLGIEAIVSSP